MAEVDAFDRFRRDLMAELRHTNPERMRRDLAMQPASRTDLDELVDAVCGPETDTVRRLGRVS